MGTSLAIAVVVADAIGAAASAAGVWVLVTVLAVTLVAVALIGRWRRVACHSSGLSAQRCPSCGHRVPGPYVRLCPHCGHHTAYGRQVHAPRPPAWELPLLAALLLGGILLSQFSPQPPAATPSREAAKQAYIELKDDLAVYLQWFWRTGVYWISGALVFGLLVYAALRRQRNR